MRAGILPLTSQVDLEHPFVKSRRAKSIQRCMYIVYIYIILACAPAPAQTKQSRPEGSDCPSRLHVLNFAVQSQSREVGRWRCSFFGGQRGTPLSQVNPKPNKTRRNERPIATGCLRGMSACINMLHGTNIVIRVNLHHLQTFAFKGSERLARLLKSPLESPRSRKAVTQSGTGSLSSIPTPLNALQNDPCQTLIRNGKKEVFEQVASSVRKGVGRYEFVHQLDQFLGTKRSFDEKCPK